MNLAQLGPYNKAIASLIVAILVVLDQIFGVNFPGISEAWVTALLTVLNPVIVYLVPNSTKP